MAVDYTSNFRTSHFETICVLTGKNLRASPLSKKWVHVLTYSKLCGTRSPQSVRHVLVYTVVSHETVTAAHVR